MTEEEEEEEEDRGEEAEGNYQQSMACSCASACPAWSEAMAQAACACVRACVLSQRAEAGRKAELVWRAQGRSFVAATRQARPTARQSSQTFSPLVTTCHLCPHTLIHTHTPPITTMADTENKEDVLSGTGVSWRGSQDGAASRHRSHPCACAQSPLMTFPWRPVGRGDYRQLRASSTAVRC